MTKSLTYQVLVDHHPSYDDASYHLLLQYLVFVNCHSKLYSIDLIGAFHTFRFHWSADFQIIHIKQWLFGLLFVALLEVVSLFLQPIFSFLPSEAVIIWAAQLLSIFSFALILQLPQLLFSTFLVLLIAFFTFLVCKVAFASPFQPFWLPPVPFVFFLLQFSFFLILL